MKSTIKSMEDYEANDPQTFAIVYKGTNEIVVHQGKEQYFRSFNVAKQFLPKIEESVLDTEIELIQIKPTWRERFNDERLKELSQELSKRKKSVPRMAKNAKLKHSEWLSHLKKEYKKHKKKINELEDLEKRIAEEENSEDFY